MMSFEHSRPAGFKTEPTDEETLFKRWSGFQPISQDLRIAWAANFGMVILKKTFAPESFIAKIWLSTVGSVTS